MTDSSLISLAFSVYTNKGCYCLILGSGISKSSGIPLGWDIVIELIETLALLQKESINGDPIEWYRTKFQRIPSYSQLMEDLAYTPFERARFLRPYFEVTEDSQDNNFKKPTEAHKRIANLIKNGYIKIVITTNFDRLLEEALAAEGITAVVISSEDGVFSLPSLTNEKCVIIKVNGDYLDARIRNTVGELESYEPGITKLLERIFEDYGVISCGWSSEWDSALRKILLKYPSKLHPSYWTYLGSIHNLLKEISDSRNGKPLQIESADAFFTELEEKVLALESREESNHPLTSAIASATIKRYLLEERHQIRLSDILTAEANRASQLLYNYNFENRNSEESITQRIKFYQSRIDAVRAMLITGCYWSDKHSVIWRTSIEAFNKALTKREGGYTVLLDLQKYPIVELIYACGVSALLSNRLKTIFEIFTNIQIYIREDEFVGIENLLPYEVLDLSIAKKHLEDYKTMRTPMSEYLFHTLLPYFSEFSPHNSVYEKAFNKFEYLLALSVIDLCTRSSKRYFAIHYGRFLYLMERERQVDFLHEIETDIKLGPKSRILEAGFFGGESLNYFNAKNTLLDRTKNVRW